MKLLVVCPNLIGDTVMATPTFRALRAGFPQAEIVAVVRPQVAPVLDGGPWFNDRILFDAKSENRPLQTKSVIDRIQRFHPDIAVLLPNSFRSALLAWRGGARRRVGYARGGRGLILTDRLTPPKDRFGRYVATPIVEYYLKLARHLNGPVDSLRTELYTTEGDEAAADLAWSRLGLECGGRPVVCLNTGGAFGPAKSWPVEHFAALGRRLAQERNASVLVLCGPGEREAARSIVAQADHPLVVSLADQTLSIGLSKASVRRSALLVTTDSGPRHFAAPFDVPVLSLFGPTKIAWTRTYHPLAQHIFHQVPCGPCQRPICPLGHHRCMTNLTPESVYPIAARMLRQPRVRMPESVACPPG